MLSSPKEQNATRPICSPSPNLLHDLRAAPVISRRSRILTSRYPEKTIPSEILQPRPRNLTPRINVYHRDPVFYNLYIPSLIDPPSPAIFPLLSNRDYVRDYVSFVRTKSCGRDLPPPLFLSSMRNEFWTKFPEQSSNAFRVDRKGGRLAFFLRSFEKRKEEIFHEKSLGRKGFEDVERIFLKQHSGKWKGLDSKRGEGRGDSMEIELPAGRRRRNKVRGGFDEREVQVDANGRPLFFLLCFPSPDPHCSCNVPGPALLIS